VAKARCEYINSQLSYFNIKIITAYISCLREDDRLRNRDHAKVYLEYPAFTQHLKENGTSLRKHGKPDLSSWVEAHVEEYLEHDMVTLATLPC